MSKKKFFFAVKYYSFYRICLGMIFIAVLFIIFASCDDLENIYVPPLQPLPENAAIFLSIDGTKGGLRIYNANSFQLMDSLITTPAAPWNVEFSPENDRLYSIWHGSPSYIHDLYEIGLKPLRINRYIRLFPGYYALTMNSNNNLLIAFGSKGIQVYDRTSMSFLTQDTISIGETNTGIAAANIYNIVYYPMYDINNNLIGFGIFDLAVLWPCYLFLPPPHWRRLVLKLPSKHRYQDLFPAPGFLLKYRKPLLSVPGHVLSLENAVPVIFWLAET